jgi:hypothetical protein
MRQASFGKEFKMNGRVILSVLLVLLLIAVVAGVGVYAYNAGVAQGMVASGKLTTPSDGVPYPYLAPFFFRPWGFGFGFFGILAPLFFFLLIFGLFRLIFWRGAWGGGGPRRYWREGVPPAFEEWHRRSHEPQQPK